jgi:D-alanyl-D-alanine carboxypeptidase
VVLRRSAVLVAAFLVVSACAPTRAAAPPDVELVGGTVGSTTTTTPLATPRDAAEDPAADGRREASTTTEPQLTGWAAVDDRLERELLANGNVAVSAAIVVDGEVLHDAAFGTRTAPAAGPLGAFAEPPDDADTDDRFRVASISKVVTAIVILQLVEDGALRLEDPALGAIAQLVGVTPTDADAAAVTVEQLLSHTSGIGQYDSLFFRNGSATCADAARQILTRSIGTPGGLRYSNANYCLLGLLIEAVTGMPYERVVSDRLLTPLGITGMRMAGTYDLGPDEVEHRTVPGRMYMEALGAAGAWIASPADIALIVDSVRPGGGGWRPLSDETAGRMASPPFGRPLNSGGYGLGLILWSDGSWGHTGTLENTHAMVVAQPNGVTWAVTVSGDFPSESEHLRGFVERALLAGFPDG